MTVLELLCRPGSACEQSRRRAQFVLSKLALRAGCEFGLMAPGSLLRVYSGPVRASAAASQSPLACSLLQEQLRAARRDARPQARDKRGRIGSLRNTGTAATR